MRLLFVLLAVLALICTIEATMDPNMYFKRAPPLNMYGKPFAKPVKKNTLPPLVDDDEVAPMLAPVDDK